ncbi:Threonine/homoserine efflux transporter RhtA [Oceanobacillus limi]|uniref:Threonine/homoserine efflux transporter RhtA n=1 Tax=Oceanobacillus limi TaxID=930131 RepID=A0A1I0AGE8_9BACI|nr:DMT family transporter [Oceanobacillus limi]SES93327.1 Threonine/homoserine efflux transporter RhtA [Oceanobacillus limi]
MKQSIAYFVTILGASFWGLTGLFVESLYHFGFTPWEVVAIRLTSATIILIPIISIFSPKHLKVKIKHLPHFFGLGVGSIVLFNWLYFTVMEQTSMSIAVVLLYTSPIFVSILSKLFFNEVITGKKVMALIMTLIGCSFVIKLFPIGDATVSLSSILLGLLSAFFCGLYSIIGKSVSKYYNFLTITTYTLLTGSLFIFPTSRLWEKAAILQQVDVWLNVAGVAIISTILAYILYTFGLSYIESSKAAILGSVEPIIAILIGVILFGDSLTPWQIAGIVMVISSAFITVYHKKRKIKIRGGKLNWRKT